MILCLINLDQYREQLKEASTYLQDAALMEIPDDAIFVSYVKQHKPHGIRLLSKSSLETSLRQNDEARAIVESANSDNSGIKVALSLAEGLSPREQLYKEFLLSMIERGFNVAQIIEMERSVCANLLFQPGNFLAIMQSQQANSPLAVLIGFIFLLMLNGGYAFFSLGQFAMLMFRKQTAIVEENRQKLLQIDGSPLGYNQIICPYTRETLNVDFSPQAQEKVNDFIDVFIGLSILAGVADSSIDSFLASKPETYLPDVMQTLLNYLRRPEEFNFTEEQEQFLQKIGGEEASRQLRFHEKLNPAYKHLWIENETLEENVLNLLIDYSKRNWCIPAIGLFFTGHWNRHHHDIVNEAIETIEEGAMVMQVLEDLAEKAKLHPNFNSEGSLMRRLEFIRVKFDIQKEKDMRINPSLTSPAVNFVPQQPATDNAFNL
ncbi:hypothetical protein Lmac_2418 [Legionella maceachernii]|uniref:RavJ-like C-terminal domain-containing protein n=1 Tax=Legionella maceachernii TaxID=466 RepID=A0A0W0VXY4_9GAMM|nr:hypothetical protein Lmac_2418 [Legionella maceachernii]SKA15856.1 hypothetical protein SAMN02745128_02326 [Legionella maceachernii]SUP01564.1 Uncharacterised protein [Legionella maceachernii]